jgi:hypothetical protein
MTEEVFWFTNFNQLEILAKMHLESLKEEVANNPKEDKQVALKKEKISYFVEDWEGD